MKIVQILIDKRKEQNEKDMLLMLGSDGVIYYKALDYVESKVSTYLSDENTSLLETLSAENERKSMERLSKKYE